MAYYAGDPNAETFMQDAIEQGWLKAALHTPSPNCNERPANTSISLLVIHNISLPPGEFGGPYIGQLFTNTLDTRAHPALADLEGLKVSAHLLIDRAGHVTQFVPFHARAWHAGVSTFEGRDNCNDFSIGIELEGTDHLPYSDAQYQRLAQVCRLLMIAYPGITPARITGHSDIAPGRKTDPGPSFDWPRFHQTLATG